MIISSEKHNTITFLHTGQVEKNGPQPGTQRVGAQGLEKHFKQLHVLEKGHVNRAQQVAAQNFGPKFLFFSKKAQLRPFNSYEWSQPPH